MKLFVFVIVCFVKEDDLELIVFRKYIGFCYGMKNIGISVFEEWFVVFFDYNLLCGIYVGFVFYCCFRCYYYMLFNCV